MSSGQTGQCGGGEGQQQCRAAEGEHGQEDREIEMWRVNRHEERAGRVQYEGKRNPGMEERRKEGRYEKTRGEECGAEREIGKRTMGEQERETWKEKQKRRREERW